MCRVARELPPQVQLKKDGLVTAASPAASTQQTNVNTVVKEVSIQASNSKIEQREALITRSSKMYEIGSLLQETSTGKVHTAVQLAPTPIVDRYIRIPDNVHSLKIYSLKQAKENQGRIQSNPWQEVSIHQYIDTELMVSSNYGKDVHTGKRTREERDEMENTASNHILRLSEVNVVDHMMYLLFPQYTHTLSDLLNEHSEGRLTGMQAQQLCQQVVKGLQTLHTIGIAHRHVSLDSIVYQAPTDTFAIDDFSNAIHHRPESKKGAVFLRSAAQSGPFLPPESYDTNTALTSTSANPFAEDIWALGIVLFTVLIGSSPLQRALPSDPYYQLLCEEEGLMAWMAEMKEELDLDDLAYAGMSLVQSLLTVDPAQRPSIESIAQHPWLAMQ